METRTRTRGGRRTAPGTALVTAVARRIVAVARALGGRGGRVAAAGVPGGRPPGTTGPVVTAYRPFPTQSGPYEPDPHETGSPRAAEARLAQSRGTGR